MSWFKAICMGMTDALLGCIFAFVWLCVVWSAGALIDYWSAVL